MFSVKNSRADTITHNASEHEQPDDYDKFFQFKRKRYFSHNPRNHTNRVNSPSAKPQIQYESDRVFPFSNNPRTTSPTPDVASVTTGTTHFPLQTAEQKGTENSRRISQWFSKSTNTVLQQIRSLRRKEKGLYSTSGDEDDDANDADVESDDDDNDNDDDDDRGLVRPLGASWAVYLDPDKFKRHRYCWEIKGFQAPVNKLARYRVKHFLDVYCSTYTKSAPKKSRHQEQQPSSLTLSRSKSFCRTRTPAYKFRRDSLPSQSALGIHYRPKSLNTKPAPCNQRRSIIDDIKTHLTNWFSFNSRNNNNSNENVPKSRTLYQQNRPFNP